MDGTFIISWPTVLAFVGFWSYGLFDAIHFGAGASNLVLTFILAALTTGLAAVARLAPQAVFFEDRWTVEKRDLIIFSGYVILLAGLSGRALLIAINGDQLFHAQYSQVHAFKAIRLLALKRGLWLDYDFRKLLWLSDVVLLTASVAAFAILRKVRFKLRLALLAVAFVTLRVAIEKLGGNVDIHPSFRLFPLWLSSALLSSSSFAFRLPQFLALAALCLYLYRRTRVRLGEPVAFLFGAAAGSLPVTLHVATLAEPSIWSAAAWTIVLFSLPEVFTSTDDPSRKRLWFRLSAVLAVGTMMRQPTFVAYLPFFAALIWKERKRLPQFWPVLIPILLMLPQTLAAILLKTPATKGMAVTGMLPKVWTAVSGGVVAQVAEHSVFGYGLALLAVAFVPVPGNAAVLAPLRAIWFSLGVTLFFSISPILWGIGRYQAEYLAPFVVFGFYQLLLICLAGLPKAASRKVAAVLAILVLGLNCHYYLSLPELNRPAAGSVTVPSIDSRILSQSYFETEKAYQFIQSAGLAGKTFYAGLGYGGFLTVIQGIRVRDWLREFELHHAVTRQKLKRGSQEYSEVASSDILAVPGIEAVLLDELPVAEGADAFTTALRNGGFTQIREFKNSSHQTTVTVLFKNQ